MRKLCHQMPGAPGYYNRDDKRREYHYNTQGLPDKAPANILKDPENNVKIFHLPVLKRDSVNRHSAKINKKWKMNCSRQSASLK